VYDAETVGDEGVGVRCQLRGELATLRRILARLPRVEPQVLEKRDVAVVETGDGLVGGGTDRVARERNTLAEQLAQSGRPRWETTTTRAPELIRALSVGREARMRPSSVIFPSFNGTFRSQRTSTRLPLRSPRLSMVRSDTVGYS